MTSKPLVSIITAAFNAERTIRATVDSIRAQTLHDWEHIIVDDGSTDGTWALLRWMADRDHRLIIARQENARQAVARNTAIHLARADFIAIIDADDQALPHRLETQIEFLMQHKNVDVLGAFAINVSLNSGQQLGIQCRRETHAELTKNIYKECPFITSTVMARSRFFFDTGGFCANLPPAEDRDLWFRGYKAWRYHNLQEPIVYYSCRPSYSWWSAVQSARVILLAARRDGKVLTHSWYALRPLIATGIAKLKRQKR